MSLPKRKNEEEPQEEEKPSAVIVGYYNKERWVWQGKFPATSTKELEEKIASEGLPEDFEGAEVYLLNDLGHILSHRKCEPTNGVWSWHAAKQIVGVVA